MLSKRQIKHIRHEKGGVVFDFDYKGHTVKNIQLASPSRIQALNAVTAFMVASSEGITTPYIRQGLSQPIKGRTHIVSSDLVMDVAHNAQAVKVLKAMLRRNFPGRRINLMFAPAKNKGY